MDPRKLAASLAASLLVASSAMAATRDAAPASRIASDFATWAGSRQNADALVAGLHHGTSIALATTAPDRSVSLAGFTPGSPMDYEQIRRTLASARAALARLGVRQPTAEQIQAALIGGEVEVAGGRTRNLPGSVAVLGGNPNVAAR
ncbi:MAG TPA: hypothetical protein VLS49_13960 [Usitatibacter sp.]|nr:hypothetical protein [Usitatibacter sp.]